MKKILLFVCCMFLCGCDFNFFNKIESVPIENHTLNSEDTNNTTTEKVPKYEDQNPVVLSLYVDGVSATLDKASQEFHTKWIKKKDITVFGILLTDEESLTYRYYQDIWKKYADNYTTTYKVGWYVAFSLSDGTEIQRMIFSPKDVDDFYDYLELYLYDSANVAKDIWYSHLLEKDMTDSTIMTSLKLTAGSKYEEITSPITVMAFTYDSEDDFDENGFYRGNSKYLVNVYND